MMPTLDSILHDAARLPVDDRVELASRLLQSVSLNDTELRTELDRRWAEHIANPDDVLTWETVRDAALARIRR
jgi:putative addiction module component (TIGR02574 family)